MRKHGEVEIEWGPLGRRKKVNSADQIDQLADVRLMTQMISKNLRSEKSDEISENEMPGIRNEIPKGAYNEYGDSARKIEIGTFGKRWSFFVRIPDGDIPDGESLIEGIFVYTLGS